MSSSYNFYSSEDENTLSTSIMSMSFGQRLLKQQESMELQQNMEKMGLNNVLDLINEKINSVHMKMYKAQLATGEGISEIESRRIERKKMLAGEKKSAPKNPNLYKTQMCRNFVIYGQCKFGAGCWYAHGAQDVRAPHPEPASKFFGFVPAANTNQFARSVPLVHSTEAETTSSMMTTILHQQQQQLPSLLSFSHPMSQSQLFSVEHQHEQLSAMNLLPAQPVRLNPANSSLYERRQRLQHY